MWQNCILCECWHKVAVPHLTKSEKHEMEKKKVLKWELDKGRYLSRDYVNRNRAEAEYEMGMRAQ